MLEEELAALRRRKANVLAAHSLIRRLPPDILRCIFEIAVHEDPLLLDDISIVSRFWRQIVVSSPTLWTYIIYDTSLGLDWYTQTHVERHARIVRKLDASLKRSGTCKLYVHLDACDFESVSMLQQVLDLLTPHLARAYYLQVRVPDWEWMRSVSVAASSLGPVLEQIHLGISRDWSDSSPCVVLTNPCPVLKYAVLENTPPSILGVLPPSLRVLHVVRGGMNLDISGLLATTSAAEQLQTLRLQTSPFLLTSSSRSSRYIFRALRTLLMHHLSDDDISAFLDAGDFPALVHLGVEMGTVGLNGPVTAQWLLRVAEHSEDRFPALRLLDLKGVSVDGTALETLANALRRLPRLTGLAISCPPRRDLGESVLSMLGTGNDGEWILPRLEALVISACNDISGNEVLKVVQSRYIAEGLSRVRYVKLSYCDTIDSGAYIGLKKVVEVVHII